MTNPRDVRFDGDRYPVVEMFTSVQTEGARCGTLAHFLRLGGCNFNCPFCDTPLDKFEMLSPAEIASHLCDLEWKRSTGGWVVITGGEPMVHNLWPLLAQIGNRFSIAMESNGSLLHQVSEKQPEVLRWIDWLTISPKTFIPNHLLMKYASEVKYVVPDHESLISQNEDLMFSLATVKPFVFVQPEFNNPEAVERCLVWMSNYTKLRLSVQSHKYIGLR